MSYVQLRSSLSARLLDHDIPVKMIHDILSELDIVSSDYDIKRACTDIITVGGLPEVVKNYYAALSIEKKAFGTIDGYRRELTKFFSVINKPFNAVSTNDIRMYMHYRQQNDNLKKSTLEHANLDTTMIYVHMQQDDIIASHKKFVT